MFTLEPQIFAQNKHPKQRETKDKQGKKKGHKEEHRISEGKQPANWRLTECESRRPSFCNLSPLFLTTRARLQKQSLCHHKATRGETILTQLWVKKLFAHFSFPGFYSILEGTKIAAIFLRFSDEFFCDFYKETCDWDAKLLWPCLSGQGGVWLRPELNSPLQALLWGCSSSSNHEFCE